MLCKAVLTAGQRQLQHVRHVEVSRCSARGEGGLRRGVTAFASNVKRKGAPEAEDLNEVHALCIVFVALSAAFCASSMLLLNTINGACKTRR